MISRMRNSSHQPKKSRDAFVDVLRGMSMITVVSLHALANYLSNRLVLHLWDMQQFAVQLLVFCSAYLYFRKAAAPISGIGSYVGKRFLRLYMPFLVFALLYFGLVWIIEPSRLNAGLIINTLLLVGGIDITWLVLLFMQLIPSFMVLAITKKRNRQAFWFYSVLIIISAVWLFFFPITFSWKWIMWLPWSGMALFSLWYLRFGMNRMVMNGTYLTAAGLFLVFLGIQWVMKQQLTIYPNKYPPNILVLLYGIVWIGIFDLTQRKNIFDRLGLMGVLTFFSKHSYPLFFTHYVVIYTMNTALKLHKTLPWWGYWVVLFATTILTQTLLNKGFQLLRGASLKTRP